MASDISNCQGGIRERQGKFWRVSQDEALENRLWQLADETIRAILEGRSDTSVKTLLEAIRAADAIRLAGHFTVEMVDLVRQILKEARLVTVNVRLSDYDEPAQFGDDLKEMEDVVGAFRGFLDRKLDEAKKANPGKIVRLNLKSG
ncbi:MAG: hypothetical protein HY731_01010 [Candidatus Tectomicrobia bacterium]|nr:hypothetical protein [Candidatus Tectomicrobia bacterium]